MDIIFFQLTRWNTFLSRIRNREKILYSPYAEAVKSLEEDNTLEKKNHLIRKWIEPVLRINNKQKSVITGNKLTGGSLKIVHPILLISSISL